MTTKHNKKDLNKKAPMFFSIDTSKLQFDETTGEPKEIQILMCGEWNHPMYGPIIIEPSDITTFKKNFDSGLRRDIPVTEGHEVMDEKPAVAWFKELMDKGQDGLWATIEWTPKGKTLLADKAYKYFSPEFFTEYEDPETREIYKDVLVGGALTNKPYFKKMSAVVLSEHSINQNYSFSEEPQMELKTLVTKKPEELTPEEIAFLKEHKAELTAEQTTAFASVLEEKPAETEDQKKAREEKEKGDANEAAGLNRDGSAKELTAEQKASNVAAGLNEDGSPKVNASESKNVVTISTAEYQVLKDTADKGAKAFAEIRLNAIKAETAQLIFSEQNSKGRVLPKDEAKVFSFMQTLTEAQRKTFAEIVKEIPASNLFSEIGKGEGAQGTAFAEISSRVQKMMSEDKALKYSDAVNKVIASDKALGDRYNLEVSESSKKA